MTILVTYGKSAMKVEVLPSTNNRVMIAFYIRHMLDQELMAYMRRDSID